MIRAMGFLILIIINPYFIELKNAYGDMADFAVADLCSDALKSQAVRSELYAVLERKTALLREIDLALAENADGPIDMTAGDSIADQVTQIYSDLSKVSRETKSPILAFFISAWVEEVVNNRGYLPSLAPSATVVAFEPLLNSLVDHGDSSMFFSVGCDVCNYMWGFVELLRAGYWSQHDIGALRRYIRRLDEDIVAYGLWPEILKRVLRNQPSLSQDGCNARCERCNVGANHIGRVESRSLCINASISR